MVGMVPRRSEPVSGSRAASTVSTKAASAASAARARADQVTPERREDRPLAAGALEQRRVELALERQDAGGQGGLRHRAGGRGAAEMAVLGERDEVAQLLGTRQGGHRLSTLRRTGTQA